MTLKFIQAGKHTNDMIHFPEFDLTIQPGEVTAIVSTVNVKEQLLNTFLGKTRLSNGKVDYLPDKKIGFFFLHEGCYERLTVVETLKYYQKLFNSSEQIESILQAVQLDAQKNKKLKSLTYSERKRVQLAWLLIQNPDIYIMEEPDQNLDIESKRILFSLLRELRLAKKVILILTGQVESGVACSDNVYRLDEKGLRPVLTKEEDNEEVIDRSEPTTDKITTTDEVVEEKVVQPIRFEKIPTKVNEKIVLFDPPEIDYIESTEGQTYLHIKGESFACSFTLNDLEERLLAFGFFRCHRSYIVNLQKVREVITWTRNSYSLVLDDSEKSSVPLSKTKMADLKGMLGLK
ncbi:LytTR family transcriptional regulator DNA-binding domain-containing protein [Psychrobacillus sp. FSL K6-4046]|uniref:LytTR family transcriptional regulator DNA-binding domain-containing protein n=1 Tax=Psychrobacillus sp. FSL K6-4046 TaxID=2921550 RepID=UPI003159E127